MTQYVINIGALPNDGTGDPLRTAFNETNLNFNQVFAAGPVLSNIRIANNSILTTNTNGNLVLAPNGVGIIQSNQSIIPSIANVRNLGSADRRWSSAYLQYANISGNLDLAGSFNVGDLTVNGNLTVTGNTIQIGNIVTDTKTIQLANTASTANAASGSGITVGINDDIATFLFDSGNNVWTTNIGLQVGGPITGTNLAVSDATIYGNVNAVAGNFTGNVTANYFIGDGSQLTNLPSANISVATDSTPGVVALGNGFSLNGSNQVTTSSLYNTNLTVPTQHYALRVDTNGVVILPDQSIINGSTLRAVAGGYAGLTTNDGENSWMWVDSSGAYIATQYNETGNSHQWTFDNTGNLTLPANTFAVNYANGTPVSLGSSGSLGNILYLADSATSNASVDLAGIGIGANGNVASFLYSGSDNLWQTSTGLLINSANGNSWLINNNSITAPSGASWTSDPAGGGADEYINSAPGGYLDLTSLHANSEIASYIHLEQTQIQISAGPSVWTFEETGNLTLPGNTFAVNYANGDPVTFSGGGGTYGNADVDAHLAVAAGNIIPVANNVQSLGNATNQWSDLWVSNNTIYINSVPLTLTEGNVLTIGGNAILSNDSDTNISTTGNITADSFATTANLYIGPDANLIVLGDHSQIKQFGSTDTLQVGWQDQEAGSPTQGQQAYIDFNASVNGIRFITGNENSTTFATTIDADGNMMTANSVTVNGSISANGSVTGNSFAYANGDPLLGGFTIDNTTLGLTNADQTMLLQTSTTGGIIKNQLALDSVNGTSTLGAFSDQQSVSFSTSDWGTGEWTGTNVNFTGATNIIDFVSSGTWNSSAYQYIRINGGNAVAYSGASYGGDAITFQNVPLPTDDPTTVTTFEMLYQKQSLITIDYDSEEELAIQAQDLNIVLRSTNDVNVFADQQIQMEGNTGVSISTLSSDPVTITANIFGSSPQWLFAPTGNLEIPGTVTSSNNIDIDSANSVTLAAGEAVTLISNAAGTARTWTFDDTGNIILPGNTFAVKYANLDPVSLSSAVLGNIEITGTQVFVANTANQAMLEISGTSTGVAYLQLPTNGNATVLDTRLHNDAGNVEIGTGDFGTNTNSYLWKFDNTGNLNLPRSAVVYTKSSPTGLGNTVAIRPSRNEGDADQELLIYPTAGEGNHLHLTTGNLYNTMMYLGSDEFYVRLNTTGNIDLRAFDSNSNVSDYSFNADGTVSWPNDVLQNPDGNSLSIYATSNAQADVSGIELNSSTLTSNIASFKDDENKIVQFQTQWGAGNTSFAEIQAYNKHWFFNEAGGTIFPTLNVARGDNPSGNITGQTLLFGDATQEAIISTPDGSNANGINSQRLVINPGKGEDSNGGEGGDIYLWAGRGGNNNGSGGDVKIRGGQGMGEAGSGGYLRIEAGDSQNLGTPGYIDIRGGDSANTYGGYVQVTGGQGGNGQGGPVQLLGGQGATGFKGGDANIIGGSSADGVGSYGNVNITAGATTWKFDNTGNLTVPGGIVGSGASPAPSLSGFSSVSALDLSATGNLTAGNMYSPNFFGNAVVYANATGYLTNTSLFKYDPGIETLTVGAVSTTGNVIGAYVKGNGSELTNLPAPTVTQDITSNGNMSIMTYDGNIKYVNYATVEPSSGNITGGNLLTGGLISATGNVSGNYFIGNGSQLTGISAANTGNVTFSDQIVIGTGISNLVSGLYLAPSSSSANAVQYLRVRGDVTYEPTHIHFDTGNNQYFNQFIGDDNKYVLLSNTGNIVINTDDYAGNSAQWTFDTTGNATFPANGTTNLHDVVSVGLATFSNVRIGGNLNYAESANLTVVEDKDGFADIIAQNKNAGGNASMNIVLVNNDPGNVYMAVGVNSSTFTPLYNTLFEIPDAGYVSHSTTQVMGPQSAESGNSNMFFTYSSGSYALELNANGAIGWGASYNGNLTPGNFGNVGQVLTSAGANSPPTWNNFSSIANGTSNVNIATANGNVTIAANASSTWTFSTSGNLSAPGNVSAVGNVTAGNVLTGGLISATANITGGNIRTGGLISATGNITGGNLVTAGSGGNITLTGGNITGANVVTANSFVGNGATLSNVATTFESTWTVPTGNSTQSFTVSPSNTYYMWVDCNIPNGILTWNATATVTNTNVPVVGAQYAWVYTGGGTPIDFTSIPNQFTGTANTIVRSSVAPSATTNRFDFGINNTSGNAVTVRYGWAQIS